MTAFTVLGFFTVKQGKIDACLKLHKAIRDYAIGHEEGVTIYLPAQEQGNPHKIWVWEEYASDEAMEDHMRTPYFLEFLEGAKTLIEEGSMGYHKLSAY